MPELAEVETLCRQLKKLVSGKAIRSTEVFDNKLAGVRNLRAGVVLDVKRVGKKIYIDLESHISIIIHLRMTGRLLWRQNAVRPEHSRWKMVFEDGNVFLVDPRRFATINIDESNSEKITNDLIAGFDRKVFLRNQSRRRVNIKALLMDPRAIAGIGNIYACEILHGSGISPWRKAATLSEKEWKNVFTAANRILKKGIEKRGTSISDWRDLYGRPGDNQHELKAYGQEGKPCKICGGRIHRIKQGGRSTFYCADCQK
jgi:formamidopyrimidine-DNA glycosylase